MRKDERKFRLVLEWDRWVQTRPVDRRRPTARDTLMFFCELQDRRSPLLNFHARGRDKWQIIHAWLLEEGRILEGSPARSRQAPSQMRAAQDKKPDDKRRS